MSDEDRQFWKAVYTAAIHAGHGNKLALVAANKAVEDKREAIDRPMGGSNY